MTKTSTRTGNSLLKECLFTALVLLMDQKDFEDITISEIAKKAGVSRMAYYRIYSSKEDILRQYFVDQFHAFTAKLSAHGEMTRLETLAKFYEFFQAQAHLTKYLQQAGLQQEVTERFIEFISYIYELSLTTQKQESRKAYEISFISGGLMFILLRWTERGMQETPEEMARLTLTLFHDTDSVG